MRLLRTALAAAIVAAATFFAPTAALAQSCPQFSHGAVLTAGQWQACFDAKQNALGYTPVNKAGDTMLGRLVTVAPGTVSGFNLTPGSAPSSPANGDFWATSSGFFGYSNGTTYGPFASASAAAFAATAPITVSFPAGVVTYAFDLSVANSWLATQTFRTLLAGTTNTYDIGTSATVSAFRTIYAGTSFVGPVGTFTTSVTVGAGSALTSTGAGGALGALSFVTPGTGVATALGVAVGSAGSFVVNGGALGSPSSAGTIPAFTLGGTIAGGGNQLNNIIVGTTTPLAGTFTTLTASTALVAAIIRPASDSTTAVQITKADGSTRVVDIDTTNARVGINRTPSASFDLDVNGMARTLGGLSLPTVGLGVGAAPDSTLLVYADKTVTGGADQTAIYGISRYNPGGTGADSIYGAQVQAQLTGTAANKTTGDFMALRANLIHQGTATQAAGMTIYSKLIISKGDATNILTNGYALYVDTPAVTAPSVLTNAYGLYVNDQTAAGTNNYAIYTNAGLVRLGGLTTDATHTDATLCWDTTSKNVYFGSGAVGICLGTSGRQFKTDFAPMTAGLDEIMQLRLQNYHYREGYGDSGARLQYGLVAQDVAKVMPDLAGRSADGEVINYDWGALVFVSMRAIQQIKADNDNLRAANDNLARRLDAVERRAAR